MMQWILKRVGGHRRIVQGVRYGQSGEVEYKELDKTLQEAGGTKYGKNGTPFGKEGGGWGGGGGVGGGHGKEGMEAEVAEWWWEWRWW